MKIRITDLLDQYHDESVMLTSSEAQQTEDDNTMKETVEIKESKSIVSDYHNNVMAQMMRLRKNVNV